MARQRSPSQICLVTNLTYNATPALLMDVEANAWGVACEATETKPRQSSALSPLPPPNPPSSGPPLALVSVITCSICLPVSLKAENRAISLSFPGTQAKACPIVDAQVVLLDEE